MLLIYNLILYFFVKDRASVFYSVYLVSIVIYVAHHSGELIDLLAPVFFSDTPQMFNYFKLFIYLGIIGYISFIRSFLELSTLLPSWDNFFKFLTILAIPLLLLDCLLMTYSNFSPVAGNRVLFTFSTVFVVGIFMFSIVSFIFPLIKTKEPKLYFIILGILPMATGLFLTIWSRLHSFEYSAFFFKIGSTTEFFVFSLGLAYRRSLILKDRQEVHFQLEKTNLIREQEQKESERLTELNEFKSRLYDNITHEFRTPLTVIMGISEQIKNNEKQKELIYRNSKSLLQLVNQMLDVAKAEEGKLKLNLVNKNIVQYIKYLTESFHGLAKSKKTRLSFISQSESIMMDYDESKIKQIITNLLSNAVKFTPPNGQISLSLEKTTMTDAAYLKICVKDSGIGIDQKDLPYVFDRFYQTDGSSTRKSGGTGIGLALIKELVDLMKGEITVSSTSGKGSTFTLLLPINNTTRKLSEISNPPGM